MNNYTLFLTLLSVASVYGSDNNDDNNGRTRRKIELHPYRHTVKSPKQKPEFGSPIKIKNVSAKAALASLGAALKPQKLF